MGVSISGIFRIPIIEGFKKQLIFCTNLSSGMQAGQPFLLTEPHARSTITKARILSRLGTNRELVALNKRG